MPSGQISYEEVAGYWVAAGGPVALASVMTAISYAESTHYPGIIQQGQPYATTGWGLWQITPGNSESSIGTDFQLLDPLVNARAAVAKFNSQGLGAWTTYTNGAYLKYSRPVTPATVNDPGQYTPVGSAPSGTGNSSKAGAPSATLLPTQLTQVQSAGSTVTPPAYTTALLPINGPKVPGFGTLTVGSIYINGAKVSAQVSSAIEDIVVERSMGQASTVTIQMTDPKRTILRSNLLTAGATLELDGLRFGLVQIVKSGDTLEAVFEAMGVVALRQQFGQVVATTQTDLTSFALYLVTEVNTKAPGLNLGFVGEKSLVTWAPGLTIGRGTNNDVLEDSWTALVRMATTAGWRVFESDNIVWLGSDQFFLSGAAGYASKYAQNNFKVIQEFTDEVQFIDFDWSYAQPFGNLNVTATTTLWDAPPGSVVVPKGMGSPISDSQWLVFDMQRDLYRPQATITLTTPMTPIQQIEIASGFTVNTVPFTTNVGNPAAGTPSITVTVYQGTSPSGTQSLSMKRGEAFTIAVSVSGGGLGSTPTGTISFTSGGTAIQAGTSKYSADAVPLHHGSTYITVPKGFGPGSYQIECSYTPADSDKGAPGGTSWLSTISDPMTLIVSS